MYAARWLARVTSGGASPSILGVSPPTPPPQRWLRPLSRTKARLAAEKTRAKQIQAEANLLPTPLARLLLPTRSAARSPVIYHSLADLLSGNRDGGSTNLRSRLI
ncbi:hypothetical protein PVAP13_3KG123107 [Panicum virgatum]|uniref:Uncharacterized protein n=1 Tax=Panicum virgatum TaxID=38727 RepID=A0A8T0UYQ4_PANVG|nr:hypothetical protein PVAP13_3KG123107 [Panicum virgatum]